MPSTSGKPPRTQTRRRAETVADLALDEVVRGFALAAGADSAVLVGMAGESGGMPVMAAWDRSDPSARSLKAPELVARAVAAKQTLIEAGGTTNGNSNGSSRPPLGLATAVRTGERTLGALEAVFKATPVMPLDRLRWIVESYAQLAALCVDGDHTLRGVLAKSGHDMLTGCLTYGRLTEILDAEVTRSQRLEHRLSCCFFDLDQFKRVNDGYGHLVGNRILTAVGGALRKHARSYDSVGRFGGDEFVVVLPETGAESAAAVAQRMRDAAAGAMNGEALRAGSVSIGIAEWARDSTAAHLLEAADDALGEAKRVGGATVASLWDGQSRFHVLVALGQGPSSGHNGRNSA
jgi:diguanylate cyclase (GGDEF)-like protein